MKVFWVFCCTVVLSGCSMFGVSSVKEPAYSVIKKHDNIEIRSYQAMLVARTTVNKPYDQAKNEGFKRLASYIFGGNTSQQSLAMTAPVIQAPAQSSKIAMTAPVTQKPVSKGWQTTFVMPEKYTLETLPKPNSDLILIEQVPAKTVAVIRFSGRLSTEKMQRYSKQLKAWLLAQGYTPQSEPVMAGYNPPWTLPGLRRNEVMVEIMLK